MFRDRRDAGQRLAKALNRYQDARNTIVLALPRGGVVVGYEVSSALRVPLEVLVTRKLGTPGNPELAMGALAETGYRHLNRDVLQEFGVTTGELEAEVARQRLEIDRRIARYRRGRPLPVLAGHTVILVDDGIATGATFYASLAALRSIGASRVVAAVPVAPVRTREELQDKAEEVVILATPVLFFGIGQFYEQFPQVEDEEVLDCLAKAQAALQGADPPAS